jgi:hypothetical protein
MRYSNLLFSICGVTLVAILFVGSSSADVLTRNDHSQSCYPLAVPAGHILAQAAPGAASGSMRLCLTAVAAARVGAPLEMRLTLENISSSARRIQRFPTETRLRFQITNAQGTVVKPWFYPIRTTISGNMRYGSGQAIPLSFDFSALWRDAPPGTYNVQACWRLNDFQGGREIEPCSNAVELQITP